MQVGLCATIWQYLTGPFQTGSTQIASALSGWVGTEFRLCVVAYLVVSLLIAGWSSDPHEIPNFFKKLFLASTVFAIAGNLAAYNYYVVGLTHGITDGISTAITGLIGQGKPVTAASFDELGTRLFTLGIVVYTATGFSWKLIFIGFAIVLHWFLSFIALFLMFTFYCISYVVTVFALGFGPIFVVLYFWEETRRFFNGWLSCLVTGMLTQVFTVALLSILVDVARDVISRYLTTYQGGLVGAVEDTPRRILVMLGACATTLMFGFLTYQAYKMAQTIAGGVNAEFFRLSLPRLNPATAAAQAVTNAANAAGGQAGGAGAAAQAATAGRSYGFNRSVGSAS